MYPNPGETVLKDKVHKAMKDTAKLQGKSRASVATPSARSFKSLEKKIGIAKKNGEVITQDRQKSILEPRTFITQSVMNETKAKNASPQLQINVDATANACDAFEEGVSENLFHTRGCTEAVNYP
jgi:hypothetical protein